MDRKAEIIEYINNNLREHLTLEGLCEHFHTNRTTLARLIKEATGKSPIRYILEQRLTKSCNDLATTDMSISEIAEKYGFADDNYFIRAFKKQYGISPLQFRKARANTVDDNESKAGLQKIERFKNLIETAKTDMAAHPAFPQKLIKYEAFAAETEKGNIYHAVLELTPNEGDELIEQMKQNDDTHIISFVCMFSDDEHSSGSYDLRKKLRKLHPENGNTVLLWTVFDAYGQHNCRQHKLKELNPLYFSNDLDIFEFHDAKLKLTRYAMNSRYLYLSVNHLNVKKNTEQNPTDSDMEIKEAHVTFSNFYMNYLRTKTRYQPNEKGDLVPIEVSETTLFEDGALNYFFDRLKEKRELTVLELKRSKNGKYFMSLDAEPGRFEMEFTISSAHVTWDEYSGEAWYEQYFRDMRARGITPKGIEEE